MVRVVFAALLILALTVPIAAAQVGGVSTGHKPSQAEQALTARLEVARLTVFEAIRELRLYVVRLEAEYADAVQALRAREAAQAAEAKRQAEAQAAVKAAEPKADAASADADKAAGARAVGE
jgi:hypothetical protein